MNFSFPITLSKVGVVFRYKNYRLTVPWFRPLSYQISRHSSETLAYKNSSKLVGLEYNDLVSEWISFKYPQSNIIVLTNINVQSRNIKFWAKVPKTNMIDFVKDVVILFCADKSEVVRLIENIPAEFADAQGYSAGIQIIDNKED